MFKQIDYLEVVNSTNEYLKAFTPGGECRAVVAREQTAGKGRHGRHWYSPPGQGLYASYLFYPSWPSARSEWLNMIAALAVVRAVRDLGTTENALTVKPPNDILIGDRKVCGILVELSSLKERISWAIVGVGINLFQKEFPQPGFHLEATSLTLEGLPTIDAIGLFRRLTSQIEELYRRVEGEEWEEVESEYREKIRGGRAPV
ncbi:MAG: biotin--[acetyl-CoA-carboxylase] ligase, partial [Acidobacteriota bacterium]